VLVRRLSINRGLDRRRYAYIERRQHPSQAERKVVSNESRSRRTALGIARKWEESYVESGRIMLEDTEEELGLGGAEVEC
jgi:hypothetical protein